jgi:hypothetical protein
MSILRGAAARADGEVQVWCWWYFFACEHPRVVGFPHFGTWQEATIWVAPHKTRLRGFHTSIGRHRNLASDVRDDPRPSAPPDHYAPHEQKKCR